MEVVTAAGMEVASVVIAQGMVSLVIASVLAIALWASQNNFTFPMSLSSICQRSFIA
ncbi:MAG: hypothetical protein ABSC55_14700 [Syntrophorhabdales bacterium]